MLVLAASLLFSTAAAADYEEVSHEEATARIEACGILNFEVSYEDYLQSDEVRILDEGLSDEQLLCAAEAMDLTFYIVTVPMADMVRFQDFQSEVAQPRMREQALQTFAQLGLGAPPEYDPDSMSISDYGTTIEQHCGPGAVGAFLKEERSTNLMMALDWWTSDNPPSRSRSETLSCIIASLKYANMNLEFIGNDKPRSSDSAAE